MINGVIGIGGIHVGVVVHAATLIVRICSTQSLSRVIGVIHVSVMVEVVLRWGVFILGVPKKKVNNQKKLLKMEKKILAMDI